MRVAVVGAGPSGIYAVDSLVRGGVRDVDVLDRLPTPYGLVRYGVAPDHFKIKSVATALRRILEEPGVRFLGNVEVGRDVEVAELRRHYDAVIFAHGACDARRLDIPGEDLPGSFSATDFVSWYCGHPDMELDRFALTARQAVVIGVGNVAVDVVRVLSRPAAELAVTDIPDHVLSVLAASPIEEVTMVGRRGPAQAKFTNKELRELGELTGVRARVHPADLDLDPASAAAVAADTALRRNLEALTEWAAAPEREAVRELRLRFWLRPVRILGEDAVTGVVFERVAVTGEATGEEVTLPAQLVLRSVGYRGVALPGLPFDPASAIIPNDHGRVLAEDGAPLPGVYVTGWIKRGPTGVIGTNRKDAQETVTALLADATTLPGAERPDPAAVTDLAAGRGVTVVDWTGWQNIDAAETALGAPRGSQRIKLVSRDALLRAAGGSR